MIGVTELRAGTIFEENGNLLQVLSYEHIKMGRGSANIKVKVKNVRTGATVDKSFINGAKVNNMSILMNPTTFEQVSIPLKIVGTDTYYLKDGELYNISFLDKEPLSINLVPKMAFVVEETAPGVKGNSATNVFKDAVLENGLTVKVPLFIKIGDKVRIDTRTAAYTEKA